MPLNECGLLSAQVLHLHSECFAFLSNDIALEESGFIYIDSLQFSHEFSFIDVFMLSYVRRVFSHTLNVSIVLVSVRSPNPSLSLT